MDQSAALATGPQLSTAQRGAVRGPMVVPGTPAPTVDVFFSGGGGRTGLHGRESRACEKKQTTMPYRERHRPSMRTGLTGFLRRITEQELQKVGRVQGPTKLSKNWASRPGKGGGVIERKRSFSHGSITRNTPSLHLQDGRMRRQVEWPRFSWVSEKSPVGWDRDMGWHHFSHHCRGLALPLTTQRRRAAVNTRGGARADESCRRLAWQRGRLPG